MDSQVIQAVKQRLNIADVVRRYVALRSVSGRWVGLCPFHQEKTPSFSVNESEGFYYCFGCQASGDVLDFYMKVNGLEFRDAVEQLATETGVEIKAYKHDPQADERQKVKKSCLDMHTLAQEYFRRNLGLAGGDAARAYLRKRGSSQEIIQLFGLGQSPDDWHGLANHLKSKGYTPEQGAVAGLLSKNEKGNIYDRFRGRLIFPIQNLSGQVIAFGGRIITEGEPKYLNSSDTPIYKKGEHLYGLYQARQAMTRSKRAILTEGYMDVLTLHQFGYADSCGVLGTALTQEQVKRLSGFCSRIDLIFDGDGAGRKAALRSAEMILHQGIACRVVLMPDGEDVDSLLQAKGRDGLEECFDIASDGLAYSLNTVRTQFAPREVVAWAQGFLSHLSDPALRSYYLPRLADGLGLSEGDLRRYGGQGRAGERQGAGQMAGYSNSHPNNLANNQANGQAGNKAAQGAMLPVGRDDQNDKAFLTFPVLYPEYVAHLQKNGFGELLLTDWANAFWRKFVEAGGHDVLSRLDDAEKVFYAKTRTTAHRLEGEELAREWEHICSCIGEVLVRKERERLKEAIRMAEKNGDNNSLIAHMASLKALNAPKREE